MKRLLYALPFLSLAVIAPLVVGSGIGGGARGPAGPAGANGVTGPTGPDWTTCSQMATSMSGATTGTCGSAVLSVSPAFTGTVTAVNETLTGGLNGVTGSLAGHAATNTLTLAAGSGRNDLVCTANGADGIVVTVTNVASGADAIDATGGDNTNSYAVRAIGTGTSGRGLRVENTTNGGGYPMVIVGDTTSPAKGLIAFTPGDANPTGAAVGDLTMLTNGVLRIATNTSPGWVSAGNNGVFSGTTAATGNSQGTVTALTTANDFYNLSGCDGTKGAKLPAGIGYTCVRIMAADSTAANTCKIYPDTGDTINGAAANAAYTHIAGASLNYCTTDGAAWFTY